MNTTVSVSVVEIATVTVSSTPYPPVSGYAGDVTTLSKVACSGAYQRLESQASAALSDGTTLSNYNFYKRVTFSSSETTVAVYSSGPCWSGNCRGLVPSQAGSTVVTASFGGVSSTMVVTVSDSEIAVTSLQIANNIGTISGGYSTLSGGVGATIGSSPNLRISRATSRLL